MNKIFEANSEQLNHDIFFKFLEKINTLKYAIILIKKNNNPDFELCKVLLSC